MVVHARSCMALGYSFHIYNFAIIKNALILLSGYNQSVCSTHGGAAVNTDH